MSLGLVGRKVGMTRIFADDGTAVPVTVIDMSNNRITQIKTPDTDGYSAVQVGFGSQKDSRVNKAELGVFKSANSRQQPAARLPKFRIPKQDDALQQPFLTALLEPFLKPFLAGQALYA